jgi:hypothetical protein
MTYYKFLRLKDNQVISDWDESAWKKNEWRDIECNPVLYAQGFYASDCITDAVQWFGNVLAEVEVRGHSVLGRVMSVHQGMRVTRVWKFSRQDFSSSSSRYRPIRQGSSEASHDQTDITQRPGPGKNSAPWTYSMALVNGVLRS